MKKITITDAANFAEITREKARYWSKLLKLEITKQGRIAYIPNGSEQLLSAMAKAVSSGLSPSLAAKEIKIVHALPATKQNKQIDTIKLNDRISSLEQAVMLLVEQNKKLSETNQNLSKKTEEQSNRIEEQNKFIISTLQTQNRQLKILQQKFTPTTIGTKQINVWEPPKSKPQKFSILQRIWYEVTDPTKLRAN